MALHTRLLELSERGTLSLKEIVAASSWSRNSLSCLEIEIEYLCGKLQVDYGPKATLTNSTFLAINGYKLLQ